MRNDNKYNSYIIENKIKKRTLFILLLSTWVFFTFYATEQSQSGHNWMATGFFMSFISSFYVFFPRIEKWIYKPWQNSPTKQEYTFLK